MAISLYDVSAAGFLQTLGGVAGFLEKGLAHCQSAGIDPAEIVETRLAPDMLAFRSQIVAVVHHSLGAIEGAKAGAYGLKVGVIWWIVGMILAAGYFTDG